MLKVLCFLFGLTLVSCSNYTVEETTVCTSTKPVFACKVTGKSFATFAMCETEKECREVCDKARAK